MFQDPQYPHVEVFALEKLMSDRSALGSLRYFINLFVKEPSDLKKNFIFIFMFLHRIQLSDCPCFYMWLEKLGNVV